MSHHVEIGNKIKHSSSDPDSAVHNATGLDFSILASLESLEKMTADISSRKET